MKANRNRVAQVMVIVFLFAWAFMTGISERADNAAAEDAATPVRRVNVPYTSETSPNIPIAEGAIFWFGDVTPEKNYADVRTIYNAESLVVAVHIFDKHLYYEKPPSAENMTVWDSVTFHLNLDGAVGNSPSSNSHQFVAQLNHREPRPLYESAYQGGGGSWVSTATPFSTETGWRGSGINNGAQARGWRVVFTIPFSSLGIDSAPSPGDIWGLGLVVHDRDNDVGTPIGDQLWPESMDGNQPSTWGELHFGIPDYISPAESPDTEISIVHGVNGAIVVDGHVGGRPTCGSTVAPNYFALWGDENYSGDHQINIQNQWDVADWPCFSKYFVTFPLNAIPAGQEIISATLTMSHFGNALPEEAQPSLIQVLRVAEPWNEDSITWNNAPLALENFGGTWVNPRPPRSSEPATILWDVSQAVAEAIESDSELRLALYSADAAQHSGKYFYTSEALDPNRRPTLRVLVGEKPLASISPAIAWIQPGDTATYSVQVNQGGGSTSPVTLTVTNPDPSNLSINLPSPVTPPTQISLQVTSLHDEALIPARHYQLPLTISSSTESVELNVSLYVGGARLYLPLTRTD